MKFLNRKLIEGSIILLILFNLFNFFNFLFQLSMARLLSVIDYGVVATLSSVIVIFSVFSESIQTIMAKYSSIENVPGKIKNLIKKSIRKALLLSISLFIVYFIISIPLSEKLKIDFWLFCLTGILILFSFLLPINRGIMQGKKRFISLGSNMIGESIIKLSLGIFFVLIGWRVYGAIVAIIFGSVLAFILSFAQLKDYISSKEKIIKYNDIYSYSYKVFVVMFIMAIFYNMDVIIARIVFDEYSTGAYALASMLGKIIFWGTLPISKAMFPLASGNEETIKSKKKIFINSLCALLIIISFVLLLFYFFPETIVKIFSGKDIMESIQILFLIGISFSIIAFANLILLYRLSSGKINRMWLLFVFVIFEAIILYNFSSNLNEFSISFIISSIIFLMGCIFFVKK